MWPRFLFPTLALSPTDRQIFGEQEEQAGRKPLLWGLFLSAVCFLLVGIRQFLPDIQHSVQVFSIISRLTTCVILCLISLGFSWAPRSEHRFMCLYGYIMAMGTCSILLMVNDPLHAVDVMPLFLVMFMALPALVRHPPTVFFLSLIIAVMSLIGLWGIGFPSGLTLSTGINEAVTMALSFFICIMRTADHVKLFQATQNLREQAERDPLTASLNRASWDQNIRTWTRDPLRQGALLFMDMDNFKAINDNHGHESGDYVLINFIRLVKARLKQHPAGQGAILARLGGEEFGLLLSVVQVEQVLDLAQDIRQSVESFDFSLPQPATVSIGVALRLPGESSEDWQHRADEAMYQAKGTGRNRVVLAATLRALASQKDQLAPSAKGRMRAPRRVDA